MKQIFSIVFGGMLIISANAQGSNKIQSINSNAKTFKVDSAKLSQKKINFRYQTVDGYDQFISALEYKKIYALDNAKSKEKLMKSDWMKNINKEISLAREERELFIKKQSKK